MSKATIGIFYKTVKDVEKYLNSITQKKLKKIAVLEASNGFIVISKNQLKNL